MSTNDDRLSFEEFETEDGRRTGLGWSLVDAVSRVTLARSRGYKLGPGGRLVGPSFEGETRVMRAFFADPVVRERLLHYLADERSLSERRVG